jgi:hypothetical protein
MLQHFNASTLQGFNASQLQNFNSLTLTCASLPQCFNASTLHNLSTHQRFKDQCFIVPGLNAVMLQRLNLQCLSTQSFKATVTLHCFNASILQHPCIKGNNRHNYFYKCSRINIYLLSTIWLSHTHTSELVCVYVCYSACKGVWAGELGLQFNPIKLSGR